MRRLLLLVSVAALAVAVAPASALGSLDPLFVYQPQPPGTPLLPPPAGKLEGPCGLAVGNSGEYFYLADYYHDVVDRLQPKLESPQRKERKVNYIEQIAGVSADNGPCGLAIDDHTSRYLVNERHGAVLRYASPKGAGKTILDPGPASGVAIGPGDGYAYVDDFDHVSVYQPDGAPVEVSGAPLQIGSGTIGAGYGIAVSGYPATNGFLYVPDATSNTVKVYDPATDVESPVATIAAGFTSLRDSAIAVDDSSGEIYVVNDLQPGSADSPEAEVDVFRADSAPKGRLEYNIIDSRPAGLAVDNSGSLSQGRVYVTSGDTELASVLIYPADAAGAEALPPLPIPQPLPSGLAAEAPLPELPPPLTCVGDSCQHLPSEPRDPTLGTLLVAAGDGPVRWFDIDRTAHVLRLRGHHHKGRGNGRLHRQLGHSPHRAHRHS